MAGKDLPGEVVPTEKLIKSWYVEFWHDVASETTRGGAKHRRQMQVIEARLSASLGSRNAALAALDEAWPVYVGHVDGMVQPS